MNNVVSLPKRRKLPAYRDAHISPGEYSAALLGYETWAQFHRWSPRVVVLWGIVDDKARFGIRHAEAAERKAAVSADDGSRGTFDALSKAQKQQAFVNWWQGAVQSHGGDRKSNQGRSTGTLISADQATQKTGIRKQQVSRWKGYIEKDIDAYYRRLRGRAYADAIGVPNGTEGTGVAVEQIKDLLPPSVCEGCNE
jgi:hypothetical protein